MGFIRSDAMKISLINLCIWILNTTASHTVDISGRGLTTIPDEVLSDTELQHLNASGNGIRIRGKKLEKITKYILLS